MSLRKDTMCVPDNVHRGLVYTDSVLVRTKMSEWVVFPHNTGYCDQTDSKWIDFQESEKQTYTPVLLVKSVLGPTHKIRVIKYVGHSLEEMKFMELLVFYFRAT